jgi:hypothetical protein
MNNYEKNYYNLNFIFFFEFFYIDIVIFKKCISTSLFRSVVAIAFQSIFHAEMHQNDFFYFLKSYF